MTKTDVLLGLQWGDEGKGKIVDVLSGAYDLIARFQGGPNAGHTLVFGGRKHVLHTIPSGIFRPRTLNLVGNGVIIDAFILDRELVELRAQGLKPEDNLLIARKAHLITPTHRMLDAAYERFKGDRKIGSTLKGIGPTYTDKVARIGLRIGDSRKPDFKTRYQKLKEAHLKILKAYRYDVEKEKIEGLSLQDYERQWFAALERLETIPLVDGELYINRMLDEGKKVLAEGAQGSMLDVDFGSYPYVTSSNTITAAVCTGLGVAPSRIGRVYGVFKAYCTRVGSGPFPTELHDATGKHLRDNGHEYGATTGRPRRCGWLDLPALRYAIMLNGVTDLVMTKADVLDDFEEIKVCTAYSIDGERRQTLPFDLGVEGLQALYESRKGWMQDITNIKNISNLPALFMDYIRYVEKQTGCLVSMVSTGPDREQTLLR